MKRKYKDILTTIARLAKAENRFLSTRFLAPVISGDKTMVRIDGVRCRMAVTPRNFCGWGIFAPISHTAARLEREATLKERQGYGRLFASVPLILTRRVRNGHWLALPAQDENRESAEDGLVPISLVDDAELFDTARACFDGVRMWFIELDRSCDPAASANLRESLTAMRHPRQLDRPGLTPAQRLAYAAAHAERLRQQILERQASSEYHVRSALEHAGARLVQFSEHSESYHVTFDVDGRRHRSVVAAKHLGLWSAGVCLSGMDAQFDLTSLVSVLREGQRRGMEHGLRV